MVQHAPPTSWSVSPLLEGSACKSLQQHAGDLEKQPVPEAEGPNIAFFRVVKLRPSRAKLVPLPPAATQKLMSSDICITLHQCSEKTEQSAIIAATPQSALSNPVAVASFCSSDMAGLVQHLYEWTPDKSMMFSFTGIAPSQEMSAFLCALMQAGAVEQESDSASSATTQPSLIMSMSEHRPGDLPILVKNGLVAATQSNEGFWRFYLTTLGANRLQVAVVLKRPVPMFASSLGYSDPKMAKTSWQLLQELERNGWQMKVAPRGKEARQGLPPYRPSSQEKIWYATGLSLLHIKTYIIVLLNASDLFDDGLTQVRHCQSKKFYEHLLTGGKDEFPEVPEDLLHPGRQDHDGLEAGSHHPLV